MFENATGTFFLHSIFLSGEDGWKQSVGREGIRDVQAHALFPDLLEHAIQFST